jgi:hypothetical protein
MQRHSNTKGHIIADYDGKRMLVDTGAVKTFYDECQGVGVNGLSRLLGHPLDGVLGMDSFSGKVLSLTRDGVHFNSVAPPQGGAPLVYVKGVPCVDIRVNEVPCRAAIITGATASYISEDLMSRDAFTRTVNDVHPVYGSYRVELFVNYFSIGNKNFFAEAGGIPDGFAMLSSIGADAVLGTDLVTRFDMIMDFSENRLYLVSS